MEYGGVAANDERKATEALDAVSNPHWQLLLQVPSTFLEEKKKAGLGSEWLGQSSRDQQKNSGQESYQKVAAVLRATGIEHHGGSEAD